MSYATSLVTARKTRLQATALAAEISCFQSATTQLVRNRIDHVEIVLHALMDFFGCRSVSGSQLRMIGQSFLDASQSLTPQTICTGRFDEEFGFKRDRKTVTVTVDGQPLAIISVDDAVSLAGMLHDVGQTRCQHNHAA